MSKKTIFRVARRRRNFSQIGHAVLRDKRLSAEARGVMGFILSFPDDWNFTMEWLRREMPLGRDRSDRIMKELSTCGYCQRHRLRNDDGSFSGYEYVFSDEPEGETQDAVGPHPEKPGVEPVTGKPGPADQGVIPNKRSTNRIPNTGSLDSDFSDGEKSRPAAVQQHVSEATLDKVRGIAPGWDRQFLLQTFLEWPGSSNARDINKAFLGWIPKFIASRKREDA
jgi:hypothetical protein